MLRVLSIRTCKFSKAFCNAWLYSILGNLQLRVIKYLCICTNFMTRAAVIWCYIQINAEIISNPTFPSVLSSNLGNIRRIIDLYIMYETVWTNQIRPFVHFLKKTPKTTYFPHLNPHSWRLGQNFCQHVNIPRFRTHTLWQNASDKSPTQPNVSDLVQDSNNHENAPRHQYITCVCSTLFLKIIYKNTLSLFFIAFSTSVACNLFSWIDRGACLGQKGHWTKSLQELGKTNIF
jgi:hypothetical protein